MYPYNFDKELFERTYQMNFNYQLFYQNYSQFNPYLYSYNPSILGLNFQNANLTQNTPYYPPDLNNGCQSQIAKVKRCKKRKRIIKKLEDFQIQNNFSLMDHEMTTKQKNITFKYFDPSRAAPITSLRNDNQLELDLKQSYQKADVSIMKAENQQDNSPRQKDVIKLQLLLKQPNNQSHPFLICKKRKNYRIMKRRYSVYYFEQRANFIKNGIPIPERFHPKNRSKKYHSQNKIDCFQALNDISEQFSHEQSVKSNFEINFSQEEIKSGSKEKNEQSHQAKRQFLYQANESMNDLKVKYQQ